MGCNCNNRHVITRPILPEFPENCDIYPTRHKDRNFFNDYSDIEKQLVAEQLGFSQGNVVVINNPDEEDITSKAIDGHTSVLSFRDKLYDPENFSGYGRKYLRKNIVQRPLANCQMGGTINQLTQEMFKDKDGNLLDNTIFIVQYDFDLDGAYIELPENSILLMQGGSFTNGTFLLNNTTIYESFIDFDEVFNNIEFRNSWKVGTTKTCATGLYYWNGKKWQQIGTFSIDTDEQSKKYVFYYGVTDAEVITPQLENIKTFRATINNPKVIKFDGSGHKYYWIVPKIDNKYISIYVNGSRNTDFNFVSDTIIDNIVYSIYSLKVQINNEFDSNVIYIDK